MADIQPMYDTVAAYARIEAEDAERSRLAAEALSPNKTALFAALAAAAITSVAIIFDGCGDSGQIESVDARIGDELAELPDVAVEIAPPAWDGSGLDRRTLQLVKAIEELAYDLLRNEHPGWEINDGAFGEFRFDVAERTITLDHNQRYTEIDTSVHRW